MRKGISTFERDFFTREREFRQSKVEYSHAQKKNRISAVLAYISYSAFGPIANRMSASHTNSSPTVTRP